MAAESTSAAISARARLAMPGGVNSSNRILPFPFVASVAEGAYFVDRDGNRFLDYHAAFGPVVLGHNHPVVNDAVVRGMRGVDIIGAGVTEPELTLAELLIRHVPSAEQVLLTNSGSEATYAALRLARATTGREKIVKFQGTYHGWHDAVLMNVISKPEMVGRQDPLSDGMLQEVVDKTVVLPFNDVPSITQCLDRIGSEIAAILVEVIPHNIGCVVPNPGYLHSLRQLADAHGAVLVFDEVVTGFRHALGGYQSLAGVTPDLTVLAKAMANGYPIAALVGRRELMERFAPGGGVFFGGTYNGHPVGVNAAIATIGVLESGDVYPRTFRLAQRASDGLAAIAAEVGIEMVVARYGSVFVPYFMSGPIERYDDLLRNDNGRDLRFRRSMIEHGIFMIPVPLKRNHVSAAHTDADIDRTLEVARGVLRSWPREGVATA